MALEDYYSILGVADDAATDEIRAAIAEKRREWTPRTGHPKLETRQLAEQTINVIAGAETILLDPSARRDYDARRAAEAASPEPAPGGTAPGRDWLQTAREYLRLGNNTQANYAAREATAQQVENADAWFVRGLTSALLGNEADAEFELSEAVRLQPDNAWFHVELGNIYRRNELWEKARASYGRASELDPSNVHTTASLGTCAAALGDLQEGHDLLKSAHERLPDDDAIAFFYANVLTVMATDGWSTYHDGSRAILTERQLESTKERLAVIDTLRFDDWELRNDVDEIKVIAERAERSRFWSTGGKQVFAAAEVATLGAALVFFVMGGWYILLGMVFLVLALLWVVVFVRTNRIPGWKWDRKQSPAYARRTGLQDADRP